MSDASQAGVLMGAAAARTDLGPSPLETEVVALFDEFRDRLLRYLFTFPVLGAHDGEEIVQETFLALFRHLQMGRSRSNLHGWLFRVAHNLALKRVQRSRREAQNFVDLEAGIEEIAAGSNFNPEDAYAQGEMRRGVMAVVRALPEQDRHCLALRAEGLRYREIADVLDISLGAVAKSLERSLQRIARARERDGVAS